jgi:response regulator RpfG family c-di-GMP phosphodiesterase
MNNKAREPGDQADDFLFAEEADVGAGGEKAAWKVIIADDEPDVHVATKLVLRDFSFCNRGIEFIDAYDGNETCELLRQNPDTAVVFLDVVMESEDSGLKAVQRIRDEIGNQMVRIILRTGQPGHAPEEYVVLNYHINDYKSKSEMTAKKLFTSLVSALRSFQDLQTIESSRRGLVKVLDAASNMDFRSRNLFVSGLLMQLGSLLDIGESDLILVRRGDAGNPDMIMAACGGFDSFIGAPVEDVLDEEGIECIAQVFSSGATYIDDKRSIYLVPMPNLSDVIVYVGGAKKISETELALIDIFCMKIVLAYDNFEAVEQSKLDQNVEIALLAKLTARAYYLPLSYATRRGRLSRAIASKLKESASDLSIERRLPELLERAAMLADIGNQGISSDILDQASALSPDDMAMIRKHPELGASMLQDVLSEVKGGRVVSLAREVALTHHENFDGSGYPQQLAGEHIPLSGRIVAVADRYMAITTPRPWRDACSHEQALEMIGQDSGTKLDPRVVGAFVAAVEAFRKDS